MKLNNINTIELEQNHNFKNLKKIIFKEIFRENIVSLSFEKINKKLQKIGPRDIRKNNRLMIKVEGLILGILKDLKISSIKSLQYPINVRILSNKSFPKLLTDYDTRYIHCDAWSGAPKNSFNAFIYLFTSENSPKLNIYKNLPKSHKYRNFVGKYNKIQVEKKYLKKMKFKAKVGNMAIWETYTPHKTQVKKSSKNFFRISIDFRFKKTSPYNFIKNYSLDQFHKSKMNNDGVYWLVDQNYKSFDSMKNKILYEFKKIKKNKFFYNLRKKYINKFYKNFRTYEII